MSKINAFDSDLTQKTQGLPRPFHPLMIFATLLGEPVIIVLAAIFAASIAWRQGQHDIAYAMVATIAASGFNGLLKYYFRRRRPNTLYVHHMRFKTYSFPSSH